MWDFWRGGEEECGQGLVDKEKVPPSSMYTKAKNLSKVLIT